MKNTLTIPFVLILILLIGVQIHFDLAERAYVRVIAQNELTLVTASKSLYSNMQELSSFDQTEMPKQVQDYMSKLPQK